MGSLENTKGNRLFSESTELSPRRVLDKETSKATASNMASQISSLRDDPARNVV